MSYQVTPVGEIRLGEKTYTLDPSFKTLAALGHAFKEDVLPLQTRIMDMRLDEIAKLISVASNASSHALDAPSEDEIGQRILDESDLLGAGYLVLKAELMTWLAVAMTPKKDREKKALELTEPLRRLKASPGETTSDSASASSAGHPKPSGKATSGK